MAQLGFTELDKDVVHVIRLASFLRLWFQCIYPLMPSCNTYCLTWVSLTLDVGYLFSAAPYLGLGGISSWLPLLTLNGGVAPLGPPAPAQPPLLRCGVTPLGRRP